MTRITLFLIFLSVGVTALAQAPKKKVLASASIFADMTSMLGGEQFDISSIVPIGGDPHTYEPVPNDAKSIAEADLVLVNGLSFEGWLNDLIANSGTKAKVVRITEGIEPISAVYKNSTDPHAWMDAALGLVYIENIKNALVELDPSNAQMFEFNYKVYRQQLEDLDKYILEQIRTIPEERRILITSHDAFQYYGRRYGLRLESVIGISTEAEAQTSDIIRLNKIIRESSVPAVFIESTVNPKLLEQIATDNQVRIGGKLFSDSIGEKESEAPTYYDMLKYNTDVIVAALSAEKTEPAPEKSGDYNFVLWIVLGFILVGGFVAIWHKMS